MAGFIPDYGAITPSSFSQLQPSLMGIGGVGDINSTVSAMDTSGYAGMIPNLGQPSILGGGGFGSGLGLNMDTAKLGLAGIGTIGSLWGAFQAASLAKKQFAYTKQTTDTNMENQLKSYNTSLTDRANSRAVIEGRTPEQTKAYIDANSLARYGK